MKPNSKLAAVKSNILMAPIMSIFNKYTLRFKLSLALCAILAFAILSSSFVLYQFVEHVMLKQAEESLYSRVRNVSEVVELLTDGIDNKELLNERIEALRIQLKAKKILQTGYYYIINSEGRIILHPSKEGQNVLDEKDLDGKPIFRTIIGMSEGRLNYHWLNTETNQPQEKVAVCKKLESLSWSVCASINEAELYRPDIVMVRWVSGLSCLFLILLIVPVAFFLAGKLQDYLLSISKRLLGAAITLNASSSLVASSSQKIDENSTLQGSAVHQTMSAVEEIKSMSERNAENSEGTGAKVQEAVLTSVKGEEAVTSLTQAIDDIVSGNDRIQNQINITNQELGNIVNVIREIDSKTKVINDIVFQTKLLSFNASVEAARAGEHGKGFAVVAEEVGNLAKMSGKAAEEISSMLAANVANVERIIKQTQDSIGRLIVENKGLVGRGSQQAAVCGKAFNEMGFQIKNIEELSSNITVASKEQAKGVDEIGKSMNHLNQILTQNALISQETTAASDDLGSQNLILNELAHDLAWSILGMKVKDRLDAESEKAIDGGLKAHAEWKNRLIRVLNGSSDETFDIEVVCKDDQCGLGKWIYSTGQQKYGNKKQFAILRETHAEFHKVACAVLKKGLSSTGENHKGLIDQDSPFGNASSVVIGNLVSLKFDN